MCSTGRCVTVEEWFTSSMNGGLKNDKQFRRHSISKTMNVDFRKDLSQIDECTVKEKGPGVLPKS